MKLRNIAFKACAFLVMTLSAAEVVKSVDVVGLNVLDYSVIEPMITIKAGQDVDQDDIRKIIKRLYRSGYFDQVTVNMDDGVLRIQLAEQPMIHDIDIESHTVPKKALETQMKSMGIEAGELLNESKLQELTAGIKANMVVSGFKRPEVKLEIEPYTKDSVNLSLTIDVKTMVKLKDIEFEGNLPFTEYKLRSRVGSRTTGALSFITNDDLLSDLQLNADRKGLEEWLATQGYFDAKVGLRKRSVTPKQRIWKNEYEVATFSIDPGERYHIASVEVQDPFGLMSAEQVESAAQKLEGETFTADKVQKVNAWVDKQLPALDGRRFVVTSTISQGSDLDVAVVISVQEVVSKVRHIYFTGNYNTKDITLRKALNIKESDLFLEADLAAGVRSLKGMQFIQTASYRVVPVSENQYDVYFEIKEAENGFGFGGSGGLDDGALTFNVFLDDKNLMGRGDSLSASVAVANGRINASLGLSQPNYNAFGVGRAFSVGVNRETKDKVDSTNYSFDELSFSANWSKRLTNTISGSAGFSYALKEFKNVDQASKLVQDYFTDRSTTVHLPMVSTALNYANIDSAYMPTDGFTAGTAFGITAPVDNAAKYYTINTNMKYYYPLAEVYDQSVVFRTRLHFSFAEGYDGDVLPFFARKYAGGVGTVRGYDSGTLGPKYEDKIYIEDKDGNRALLASREKPKGGGALVAANAEVQLPSPYPSFVVPYLFVDMGNVFEQPSDFDVSELRGSAGLSLVATIPMVQAKVSVSLAMPFNQGDEKFERFSFGIGTTF